MKTQESKIKLSLVPAANDSCRGYVVGGALQVTGCNSTVTLAVT